MEYYLIKEIDLAAHLLQTLHYSLSNEDRRECTEDYTENHGEGEAADACTTKDEDTQQHEQRRPDFVTHKIRIL